MFYLCRVISLGGGSICCFIQCLRASWAGTLTRWVLKFFARALWLVRHTALSMSRGSRAISLSFKFLQLFRSWKKFEIWKKIGTLATRPHLYDLGSWTYSDNHFLFQSDRHGSNPSKQWHLLWSTSRIYMYDNLPLRPQRQRQLE